MLTGIPLAASVADLDGCLKLLGGRPLKLVAEAVEPLLKESEWLQPQWSFQHNGHGVTDRKLLPLSDDFFQFSVADENCEQDYHLHTGVFEIYASSSPMEIGYVEAGEEKILSVRSGFVIVPPGVAHQVTLHGLTFVFQAATQGGKVHGDKILVDRNVALPVVPQQ
jgi:hypothetical protein